MASATISLSSKGQVVIPKKIRDQLHWKAGTRITLVHSASGLTLKEAPKKTGRKFGDLIGLLKHRGSALSTTELCLPVDYRGDAK